LPQAAIAQVVHSLPKPDDANLLIGAEGFSDASVYQLENGLLMVQSLDFFPPLVNDPFIYGQIAAANSLSDIFAMGAAPVTALNIVAFPDDKLDLSVLTDILRGGDDKVRESGAVVAGGHTVRDVEIKYGLSVTGICRKEDLHANCGAEVGDVLVLTKPIGTGFVTTAMKAGKASQASEDAAIDAMRTLNMVASASASAAKASAVTDITGFGLAGHAREVAMASGVTLNLQMSDIPQLPDALAYYRKGLITRASASNRSANEDDVDATAADSELIELLYDPQTSGGLLISVSEDRVDSMLTQMQDKGCEGAVIVGHVSAHDTVSIVAK
jgi:selenide,water dikinase|tara:strand:- start:1240 stop:2223 length:984 start_codon:yes stop_codon:yes gene_type:complete